MRFDVLVNQNIINTVTALVGSLGYLGFAWLAMHSGHFHEDAYILFKYVENIVVGNGISFSPHLGPAEGATDFLWLMLLSCLHYMGLSVGWAANIVNTVGVFITILFLNKLSDHSSTSAKLYLSLLVLTLLLSSLSYAAGGGFSVWAYSSIIAPILYLYFSARTELWHWIPMLALVLGLFRPDGLIIGAVFTLIAAWELHSQELDLRQFLLTSVLAFVLGGGYFLWRVSYFESLLPLPLLVKSETTFLLEGWIQNWAWMLDNATLIIGSLFALFLLPKVSKSATDQLNYQKVFMCALPFMVHLCAIGFAHQSQNVGYRFQAPQLIFLYAALLYSLTYCFRQKHLVVAGSVVSVLLFAHFSITGIAKTTQNFRFLAGSNYINVFPLWFNEQLPKGSLVAITEAGRLPFWSKNYRFIDLVGLNTSQVAKNGLDLNYLIQQNPSVLFIWYDTGNHEELVADVKLAKLAQLNQEYKRKKGVKPLTAVLRASVVAADYLVQSGEYDMISVYYWNSHNHLFAFKKGLVNIKEVKRKIEQLSQVEHDFSYAEMSSVVVTGSGFKGLYVEE